MEGVGINSFPLWDSHPTGFPIRFSAWASILGWVPSSQCWEALDSWPKKVQSAWLSISFPALLAETKWCYLKEARLAGGGDTPRTNNYCH